MKPGKMSILSVEADKEGDFVTKIGIVGGKVYSEKTCYFDGDCVAVNLSAGKANIREDRPDSSNQIISLPKCKYNELAKLIVSGVNGAVANVTVVQVQQVKGLQLKGFKLIKDKDIVLTFDEGEQIAFAQGVKDGSMLLAGIQESQLEGEQVLAEQQKQAA